MSDNVLVGEDLENLLLSWQKKYGEEQLNKAGNIFYKIADMRTALNALVNTFITKGYDYNDLKSNLLSKQIQIAVTPHKYDGKLAEWRLIIDKQWKNAINDYFPTEIEEATVPKPRENPTVILEKPPINTSVVGVPSAAGVILRSDGTTYKERPMIDRAKNKDFKANYVIVDNDPLAFLKKGKNE